MSDLVKFETMEQAEYALECVNDKMFNEAAHSGYDVDNGIIGLKNGKPAPQSTKTTTWAEIIEYDGGFCFARPDRYMDALEGLSYDEIEYIPEEPEE